MLGCVYGDNVLPFLVLRDAGWSEKRGEAIVAGVATFWRQDARRGHLVFRTPFFLWRQTDFWRTAGRARHSLSNVAFF